MKAIAASALQEGQHVLTAGWLALFIVLLPFGAYIAWKLSGGKPKR